MNYYRIKLKGIFEEGLYESPELAWEDLKKIASSRYNSNYANNSSNCVKDDDFMILFCEHIAEFKIEGFEYSIPKAYFIPIFAGYCKQKLIRKDIIDDIRSICIV